MPGHDRPPASFIADHPALDFLNSIAQPRAQLYDWLDSGTAILDWLIAAGLCTQAQADTLSDPSHGPALDQAAQDIRAFRETFRAFIDATHGAPPPVDHPMIETLNDFLAHGTQRLHLNMIPAPALTSQHRIETPADLLPRIAATCADLIAMADFAYLRNCEGPTCTLYFLDLSKNHKRRWCSMKVCGNRAKAAAHRAR